MAMGAVGYLVHFTLGLMLFNVAVPTTRGLLYPRESETREVRTLDGLWNFVKSDPENPTKGIREKWYADDLSKSQETIPMPVPASYNDITEDAEIRDHVGTVWYDRKFYVPSSWSKDQRVWIRFGSVHYEAYVWINGELMVKHEIGHLPFEAEITDVVKFGQENRITVLCDNALIQTTIPQGKIIEVPKDGGVAIVQTYTFDFFNYAGIHRSVVLYTTPKIYIDDVTVATDLKHEQGRITTGLIFYEIKTNFSYEAAADDTVVSVIVQVRNKEGNIVGKSEAGPDLKGSIEIDKVKPWWPYLMNPEPGYLYTLEVFLSTAEQENIDIYRLKVGLRTLSWNSTSFLINGKVVYFRGFGRHEDSDIRGKGLDFSLLAKDFNLIKWVGGNAYRTSHYPYSEESMNFADEAGIMVISECPSVDTENYSQALLDKHKSSLEQLVHRDKNHPSVVMWSIANEPRTGAFNADSYFGQVANYTKSLDITRPITASIAVGSDSDKAAQHLDILSFNRYNGWYSNPGRTDMITERVIDEASQWNKKHNKPVLMSEYGADTVAGLHLEPSFVWSEEYQTELMSAHFRAFDILRKRGFFIGEFIWNFADFKTAQTTTRVGGNRKGIFTRDRQPKASAHFLRKRYFALGQELDRCELPDSLFSYISDFSGHSTVRDLSDL